MFIFNPDDSQVPLTLSPEFSLCGEKGRVGCGTEYRFKDSRMLHKHPPVNAVVLLIIKGKYKIQNIYEKKTVVL